ncbi:hypothetical protein CLOP_g24182 [Closterium sp. NIES-67]|nr:hypothetical protein CLOP_g24182 [Closterium sp. NIES-67]
MAAQTLPDKELKRGVIQKVGEFYFNKVKRLTEEEYGTGLKEHLKTEVFLLDDTPVTVSYDMSTTVGELLAGMDGDVGEKDSRTIGLYEHRKYYTTVNDNDTNVTSEYNLLDEGSYMGTVMEELEKFKGNSMQMEKSRLLLHKKYSPQNGGSMTDPVLLHACYAQVRDIFQRGGFFLKRCDVACLAALELHVEFGMLPEPQVTLDWGAEVGRIIPTDQRPLQSKEAWKRGVLQLYRALPSLSQMESSQQFLRLIANLPYVGSEFYSVRGERFTVPTVLVGINRYGIHFLWHMRREYLYSIKWSDVSEVFYSPTGFTLTLRRSNASSVVTLNPITSELIKIQAAITTHRARGLLFHPEALQNTSLLAPIAAATAAAAAASSAATAAAVAASRGAATAAASVTRAATLAADTAAATAAAPADAGASTAATVTGAATPAAATGAATAAAPADAGAATAAADAGATPAAADAGAATAASVTGVATPGADTGAATAAAPADAGAATAAADAGAATPAADTGAATAAAPADTGAATAATGTVPSTVVAKSQAQMKEDLEKWSRECNEKVDQLQQARQEAEEAREEAQRAREDAQALEENLEEARCSKEAAQRRLDAVKDEATRAASQHLEELQRARDAAASTAVEELGMERAQLQAKAEAAKQHAQSLEKTVEEERRMTDAAVAHFDDMASALTELERKLLDATSRLEAAKENVSRADREVVVLEEERSFLIAAQSQAAERDAAARKRLQETITRMLEGFERQRVDNAQQVVMHQQAIDAASKEVERARTEAQRARDEAGALQRMLEEERREKDAEKECSSGFVASLAQRERELDAARRSLAAAEGEAARAATRHLEELQRARDTAASTAAEELGRERAQLEAEAEAARQHAQSLEKTVEEERRVTDAALSHYNGVASAVTELERKLQDVTCRLEAADKSASHAALETADLEKEKATLIAAQSKAAEGQASTLKEFHQLEGVHLAMKSAQATKEAQWAAERKRLQETIDRVEEKCEKTRADCCQCQQAVDVASKEAEEARAEAQRISKDAQGLEKKLEETRREKDAVQARSSGLAASLTQHQMELEDARTRLAAVTEEAARAATQEEELQNLRRDRTQHSEELQQARTAAEELRMERVQLEAKAEAARQHAQSLEKTVEEERRLRDEVVAQKSALASTVTERERELNDALRLRAEAEERANHAANEASKLQHEKSLLDVSRARAEEAVANTLQLLHQLTTNHAAEKNAWESERTRLQESFARMLQNLERQQEANKKAVERGRADVAELKAQLGEALRTAAAEKNKKEELQRKVDEYDEELRAIRVDSDDDIFTGPPELAMLPGGFMQGNRKATGNRREDTGSTDSEEEVEEEEVGEREGEVARGGDV